MNISKEDLLFVCNLALVEYHTSMNVLPFYDSFICITDSSRMNLIEGVNISMFHS